MTLFTLLMLQFCLGAEFRNLGFDEAATTGLRRPDGRPQGPADPTAVLPGWSLFLGNAPPIHVYVNVFPPVPPEADNAQLGQFRLMERKYALLLQRRDPWSPVWRLEQTGTIPAGTMFLTYRCMDFGMQVQINEEIIPPLDWQFPGQPGISNLVYDVSRFAGREVKLALVGPFGPYWWPDRRAHSYVDSVMFLAEEPRITATVPKAPSGTTDEVTLRFTPHAGRINVVEFKDDFDGEGQWQVLPGAPHNSGTASDTNAAPHRFYRLRAFILQEPL